MSEIDKKALGAFARSIEALFAGEEALETTVTAPSDGAGERHPEVSVQLGFEAELDAPAETVSTDAPGDGSEAELVTPVETEGGKKDAPEETIQAEPPPVELDPALDETAQALSKATSQYVEAPIDEREAAQGELRSAVEAARAAGGFDGIASTVNLLILQGAGDTHVPGLTDEFVDEDVLASMVAQLGRVRDEEEREALIEAYVRLGEGVAELIAGALTATEDRLARKTYVAALGAFGATAAHAVEKMLKDRRWFVVRNGVAVLGVVGGPSAIEHLMGSLAHNRAEVRKETVRSLAKIGGENAETLASSMLGDSDAKVRIESARAVAALKAGQGYKQLIEILKRGDEEEVIEQVLRTLGVLGDPSAVPEIEKRVKSTIFSRSPTEVRLAGLAALVAIGTPHGVGLVKKARTDKDPTISSAAARLLAGK